MSDLVENPKDRFSHDVVHMSDIPKTNLGSVRCFPMVPLVILQLGELVTIGTNGFTNGTIGRTLNDIGIPLVP